MLLRFPQDNTPQIFVGLSSKPPHQFCSVWAAQGWVFRLVWTWWQDKYEKCHKLHVLDIKKFFKDFFPAWSHFCSQRAENSWRNETLHWFWMSFFFVQVDYSMLLISAFKVMVNCTSYMKLLIQFTDTVVWFKESFICLEVCLIHFYLRISL